MGGNKRNQQVASDASNLFGIGAWALENGGKAASGASGWGQAAAGVGKTAGPIGAGLGAGLAISDMVDNGIGLENSADLAASLIGLAGPYGAMFSAAYGAGSIVDDHVGVSDWVAEQAYDTIEALIVTLELAIHIDGMTEEEAMYMSSGLRLNVPEPPIVHEPRYAGYHHIPDMPPESLVCE